MRIVRHCPVQSRKAFEALSNQHAASNFRHIKKYTKFQKQGPRIDCEYSTLFGTIRQTMFLLPEKIIFKGTGPQGTSFHGCWTYTDRPQPQVHLEQHIQCPFYAKPFVASRVKETLDDIRNILP